MQATAGHTKVLWAAPGMHPAARAPWQSQQQQPRRWHPSSHCHSDGPAPALASPSTLTTPPGAPVPLPQPRLPKLLPLVTELQPLMAGPASGGQQLQPQLQPQQLKPPMPYPAAKQQQAWLRHSSDLAASAPARLLQPAIAHPLAAPPTLLAVAVAPGAVAAAVAAANKGKGGRKAANPMLLPTHLAACPYSSSSGRRWV